MALPDQLLHSFNTLLPVLQLMLLVASAPKSSVHSSDLATGSQLQFRVHAREMGKAQVEVLEVDLLPFVVNPNHEVAGPLSNGHQSIVIAGVYTVSRRIEQSCMERMLHMEETPAKHV